MARKIVQCQRCKSVVGGDINYEKVDYCPFCGQWLEWDKHSRLDRPTSQGVGTINPKHYNDNEWWLR